MMKIVYVEDRTEMLIDKLCDVWEKSVRATHLFLSDSEVKEIAKYVPGALKQLPHLIIATNNENEPVAFMGIDGKKIESLFISREERGKGLGKRLIQY